MNNTRAFDYGIFQFYLDDEKLGKPVDLYSKANTDKQIPLGTEAAGPVNTLRIAR